TATLTHQAERPPSARPARRPGRRDFIHSHDFPITILRFLRHVPLLPASSPISTTQCRSRHRVASSDLEIGFNSRASTLNEMLMVQLVEARPDGSLRDTGFSDRLQPAQTS